MKKIKFSLSIVLLFGWGLLSSFACSSSKKSQTEVQVKLLAPVEAVVPDSFVLPQIPSVINDPEERAKYLTMHYWDRFDFENRDLIQRPEITEQAFVDYINILGYVPKEDADSSLAYTIKKAEVDSVMYFHFVKLFEKYLYDPNSPFRNEEYYLPVLEEVLTSSLVSEVRRSKFAFQLEMANRNRVGMKAADFAYWVASGKSFRLHDLVSEYTLLVFTNPGCSTCAEVIKQLATLEPLTQAMAMNSRSRTMLSMLIFSPEADQVEWQRHHSDVPNEWIYAYDKSGEVLAKNMYDIKAYPTLYLLDKEKNVILKDTSIEALESFFSIRE